MYAKNLVTALIHIYKVSAFVP